MPPPPIYEMIRKKRPQDPANREYPYTYDGTFYERPLNAEHRRRQAIVDEVWAELVEEAKLAPHDDQHTRCIREYQEMYGRVYHDHALQHATVGHWGKMARYPDDERPIPTQYFGGTFANRRGHGWEIDEVPGEPGSRTLDKDNSLILIGWHSFLWGSNCAVPEGTERWLLYLHHLEGDARELAERESVAAAILHEMAHWCHRDTRHKGDFPQRWTGMWIAHKSTRSVIDLGLAGLPTKDLHQEILKRRQELIRQIEVPKTRNATYDSAFQPNLWTTYRERYAKNISNGCTRNPFTNEPEGQPRSQEGTGDSRKPPPGEEKWKPEVLLEDGGEGEGSEGAGGGGKAGETPDQPGTGG